MGGGGLGFLIAPLWLSDLVTPPSPALGDIYYPTDIVLTIDFLPRDFLLVVLGDWLPIVWNLFDRVLDLSWLRVW